MPSNGERKHPYLKGYVFWAPIITDWINSPSYTEKAKQEFRLSLEEMLNDKNLLKVEIK